MTSNVSYRLMLHRMGYYDYQQGLIYRHLNQEGGWSSHLENCRKFILDAADIIKPSVITVLGSGWLLDVPLTELAERATTVNLVDIVHPPEVKSQVAGLKNVILREDDVTGGLISEVWKKAGHRTFLNKLRTFGSIDVSEYQPQYDPGMVVSLNIITQLETIPLRLLRKKSSADMSAITGFRKLIQEKHLSFLLKHRSVLISDIAEVETESSGRINEIRSLLAELPESEHTMSWTWNFETRAPDFYTKKSVFRVTALII
ncbi:MAG: hypothetical protein WCE64_09300 [Bacteroidales bacterium]